MPYEPLSLSYHPLVSAASSLLNSDMKIPDHPDPLIVYRRSAVQIREGPVVPPQKLYLVSPALANGQRHLALAGYTKPTGPITAHSPLPAPY